MDKPEEPQLECFFSPVYDWAIKSWSREAYFHLTMESDKSYSKKIGLLIQQRTKIETTFPNSTSNMKDS